MKTISKECNNLLRVLLAELSHCRRFQSLSRR